MAEDIVPALLEKVQAEFERGCEKNVRIQGCLKKLEDGTATLFEASQYAKGLGEQLSIALQSCITEDALPDGKMYYNIANRIITTTLKQNYNLTNAMAAQIQALLNDRESIHIKAVKAPRPDQRIKSIVDSLTEDGVDFSVIQSRMDAPVRNISQSFFDDYVSENAKFRYKAGLDTHIVRRASAKACEWCRRLAGTYLYPDDIPEDVFRKHDNCGCAVLYQSGRFRQDVHNNRWYDADENALNARKLLGMDVTKLSPREAAIREQLLEEEAEKAAKQAKKNMIEQYQRTHNVSHRRAANRVTRMMKSK